MEHGLYLISQLFFAEKSKNVDQNNVFLAIAINMPQRLKTDFVVQGLP